MSRKPKALKGKVLIGYLMLFAIAAISVWFVYAEILKIAVPDKTADRDNQRVLLISNAITGLYGSEAIGRTAILTGKSSDLQLYNSAMDSINSQIETIKLGSDEVQLQKLDSIQQLLVRKRNSIGEIITFRNAYSSENAFDRAVRKIYRVKDSLARNVQPVEFTDNTQLRKFLNNVLTPKQLDSLSRLPVSNDELTSAIETMLTNIVIKDNKMRYDLFQKEQRLQDESRVISDQLRIVLSSLENDIIERSYERVNISDAAIAKTGNTIKLVGIVTLALLIVFAWIIIRDLSTNQRYRIRLEELNSEKEDLLRSKMMLLATVTHDIQTPLGSVIGFSDLLKSTDLNSKQLQYLDNIKHSSNYILRLVNDLIDFSKLENNKIAIEKISFNFKDLIENTCKPLEPNATHKRIELNWVIDDELDANYVSDPYRIKQVLTNLISNAIKFTQQGSVEVTAVIEDGNIVVSVIDTGIGIAASQQGDVFKEFTQAHAGIEKKFGGTGLGLTIAQRMLNLLGGNISVESVEGQGSIFTFTIPAQKSEAQTSSFNKERRDTAHDFLKDKRILIVDDDLMQLSLMREVFASFQVHITTEQDGSKVIRVLEQNHFDIVLSDIQMPQMDGFELVRQIRKHADTTIANLPVVALSGKRNLDDSDFTSRGFTASHPKPIQLNVLLSQLRKIFKGLDPGILSDNIEANSENLFELRSLHQFTQNDPNSLRLIIDTFESSTRDNCNELVKAAEDGDREQMSQLAHKMLPMLRQMEVYSIVKLLEPIELKTLALDKDQMIAYVGDLCVRIDELITGLKLELT